MTDLIPITCEARLMGLSKARRKDGDWVEIKFHIHPDDHPHALFILPLGTDCTLSIKGPEASTKPTEAPAETARPKGGPICKRAVMLCKKPDFQNWIAWDESLGGFLPMSPKHVHRPVNEDGAKAYLCRACGIESRTELDHDGTALHFFLQIERDFHASQHGQTDAALMEQRR